jgi:signal transduction histidine kinase
VVLLNLLLNAIEAVDAQSGRIGVEARDAGAGQSILVTDNGRGIAAADREQIFEPYFTKRADGTGLGLALVRRIVEEHQGTIRVVDRQGSGACFEITLQRKE